MHILILTNLYPPSVIGGYELACFKAAQGLKVQGHRISILTSTYGTERNGAEENVYRMLRSDLETNLIGAQPLFKIWAYLKREIINHRAVRKALGTLRPDIVYIWNPRFLPISCISLIQKLNLPVSFYVFDHWMLDIEKDPLNRFVGLLKGSFQGRAFLKSLNWIFRRAGMEGLDNPVRFDHVQFSTRYLQREAHKLGIRPVNEEIIYWGIEGNRNVTGISNVTSNSRVTYGPTVTQPPKSKGRILFVGQLVPHKGVHLILEALRILLDWEKTVSLTLVGGSSNSEYQNDLRLSIGRLGLEKHVNWMGKRSEREIQDIYLEHDILVFPSVWEEPFGIVQLEAMQNGLAVVSTGTGGAGEIIQHGVNGLIFDRNDPKACARCIEKLLEDGIFFETLIGNARKTLSEKFDLGVTISRMEESLSARLKNPYAMQIPQQESANL